jgi:hypothetical protein
MSTRDDIRSAVFSGDNRKSEVISIYGKEVELKQPSLREALEYQDTADRAGAMAKMLIRYCFVPETNERVFEDADTEMLLNLPFGKEITELNKAIARLTGTDVDAAEAAMFPLDTTS